MATKVEELIHSLQTELTRVISIVESLQAQFREADIAKLRERLAVLDARLTDLDLPALIAHIATLQEQVAELKKWREESERRRWQVLLAIGVCVLTFTSNIVINLLLYFSRKPG